MIQLIEIRQKHRVAAFGYLISAMSNFGEEF